MKPCCPECSGPRGAGPQLHVGPPIAPAVLLGLLLAASCGLGGEGAAPLPPGVQAVWDLGSAHRESTSTRERICLNGLWQWQPAAATSERPPAENWGWFKVPGCWPGITDYMQKDCQTVFAHPTWKNQRPGGVSAAWYQREFTIPETWAGRRVALRTEYLNSFAAVYVGDPAGRRHLEALGLKLKPFDASQLSSEEVLVLAHGARPTLAEHRTAVADWLRAGGHLLAIGLDEEEARALLPIPVSLHRAEHLSAFFEPPGLTSRLAGIGPADVHNRDPRMLPLVVSGAQVIGNGVLARADHANVVFCQLAPWQFEAPPQAHLRRTHRRGTFLVSRLLANLGVAGSTPLLDRFHQPVDAAQPEQRWLTGFYLDQPQEWDDPYRFFRW